MRRTLQGLRFFGLYRRDRVLQLMAAKSHYKATYLAYLKRQTFHVLS